MSKDTLRIGIHALDCIIIGKRRQDDVRFSCEFSDAVSDRCAVLDQRLGRFATPVVRYQLVAVVEQTSGHAASHIADANKTKFGIFSNVALSSGGQEEFVADSFAALAGTGSGD